MRDHPVIENMESFGYPSWDYIQWETENEDKEDEEE